MSIIAAIIGAIAKVLFGRWFGKHEPTEADRAAEAATAETELEQEEAANAILTKAAAARAAAERVGLRDNGPPDAVKTDPDAPVNQSRDAHFRD
jgi:hypothetical protein